MKFLSKNFNQLISINVLNTTTTQTSTRLHLFTEEFPFGTGEQFIVPELEFLATKFDEIYLYPIREGNGVQRSLPKNVKVIITGLAKVHGIRNQTYILFQFLIELFRNLSFYNTKKRRKWIYSIFRINFSKAEWLKENSYMRPNDIYYSYWMLDWPIVLSILKVNGKIKKFISRAHGGDLYDERRPIGTHPYRKYVLKRIHKVISISKLGNDYLTQKNIRFKDRINTSYLGTVKYGDNPSFEGIYRIVSCSSMIKLKRIELIAQALEYIKEMKIEWVHFGDGEERHKVEEVIRNLPGNLIVQLRGATDNGEILEYYRTNHISFFISVSESEGIPFSIMEAISFGIPVVATDVGGVSEIASKDFSVLCDGHINAKDLSNIIQTNIDSFSKDQMRRVKARNFWNDHFNATNNYPDFYQKYLR